VIVPDYSGYTNEAAYAEAAEVAMFLADASATPPVVSKVRLFDGTLTPTVNTTKEQFVAAETKLTGYPNGGYTVTVMSGPLFVAGGGAVITSNLINAVYASGDSVTIGGWWLEDPNGDVREYYVYNPQRQLAIVGNGIQILAQLGYGRNG
jgi:hypothetical protein